jgi:hypothetical protein
MQRIFPSRHLDYSSQKNMKKILYGQNLYLENSTKKSPRDISPDLPGYPIAQKIPLMNRSIDFKRRKNRSVAKNIRKVRLSVDGNLKNSEPYKFEGDPMGTKSMYKFGINKKEEKIFNNFSANFTNARLKQVENGSIKKNVKTTEKNKNKFNTINLDL